MEIDLGRWADLLHQLADSRYALRGCNQQLQQAQSDFLDAQAGRDRCAGERALGHGHSPDIVRVAQSNLAAAEERLAARRAELERVQARHAEVAARFAAQSAIVEKCSRWATSRGIILPDAADLSARASVPETRAVDYSPFAAAMAAEGATAPSSTAPVARSDPAGQPPGWIGRLRDAFGSAAQ